MSVELTSAPKGAKALASADPHGKKTGKGPDTTGNSGFSALMTSLSAADDAASSLAAETSLTDAPLTEKDKLRGDVTGAESGAALFVPPLVMPVPVPTLATANLSAPVLEAALGGAALQVPSELTPTLALERPAALTSGQAPNAALGVAAMPVPVPTLATATANLSAPVLEAALGGAALQVPSELTPTLALERPAALTSGQALNAALGVAVDAGATTDTSGVPPQLVDLALPQSTAGSVGSPVKEGKEISSSFAEPYSVANRLGQSPTSADTGALQKATLTSAASDAVSVRATGEQTMADMAQTSTVGALLAHKNAAQAQGMGAAPQDYKEVRASTASQSPVPAADASATLLAGSVSDFVRPQGRFGARPGFGQSGSSGFEGAFGQAMAATHRSDAVFEVPPASAAVADTAVAETVSYWASQGVQTAELTLDGFGDSPVEVSILLNGDQAQIDFRTDQEGVRQVLEAATAQLKDLLSSQGLALAGVSVGTSGKGGDTGGDRRSRQDTKQVTLVKADAIGSVATRAANPAVGRSLDLFV